MEPIALSSLIYFLTSLFLLTISLQFLRKNASRFELPPGPSTLPIIGSLHHIASSNLAHRMFRDLAMLHGPLMHIRAGETDLVVVSSREAAKEVLQTHDANCSNRPSFHATNAFFYGCRDIAFSNGPHWHQLRRLCNTELLSPKQVRLFSSIRKDEINALLKSFSLASDKTPTNMTAMSNELINNVICRAAFGERYNNRGAFFASMHEVRELLSCFHLSDYFPSLGWLDVKMRTKVAKAYSKMDAILMEFVQDHLKSRQLKKKTGDEKNNYNLLDVLIDIMESGNSEVSITIDHIKAIIMDLFIGGTDSTALTLAWAMTELIRRPEAMARAQEETRQAASINTSADKQTVNYIQYVIKEMLRLHPAAPLLIARQCKDSCQVLGYTIPSGSRLAVNVWAIGRDPAYWDDPDEFKPERFETSSLDFKGRNFEFLPFGAGRRICPGLTFSVILLEEALTCFLLHFDWKLPQGMKPEDVDMTEIFGTAVSKKEPLYLVPTLRVPLPDM